MRKHNGRALHSGYRGVSVMWQPRQMKSPRNQYRSKGARCATQTAWPISPGRLWAITGHPDRKNIEVWC